MEIRPIRTEADYEAALAEIDRLMDAEPDTPEGDRLDVLATLVEAYEDRRYPMAAPDPVAAILHQMEVKGLSRQDLEPMLGSRARVSDILDRRRPLTLAMIRRLSPGLGIPADILIRRYRTTPPQAAE